MYMNLARIQVQQGTSECYENEEWGMGNVEWGFLTYIDVEMPHLSYM